MNLKNSKLSFHHGYTLQRKTSGLLQSLCHTSGGISAIYEINVAHVVSYIAVREPVNVNMYLNQGTDSSKNITTSVDTCLYNELSTSRYLVVGAEISRATSGRPVEIRE